MFAWKVCSLIHKQPAQERNERKRHDGLVASLPCHVIRLTPIGTMRHELICANAGMYGPQMAKHIAMEIWTKTYREALGTFLYATYGWRIFSLNFSEDFARMFKGLRVDSGDNRKEFDLIIGKYR